MASERTAARRSPAPSARWLAYLVAAALALNLASGRAQVAAEPDPIRIDVIVSDLGSRADRGILERRVAEAWAARVQRTGGVFGLPVQVEVRSDASDPDRAVRQVEAAIADGAHAVVCCSTATASRRVAATAAAARIPLLSVTAGGRPEAAGWQFVLAPSDTVALQAVVRDGYERGVRGFGLMTLEGAFGDEAADRFASFLGVPDLRVVGEARYGPTQAPLTPEALWVATRVPDAIVVWGLPDDTVRAVRALDARGWRGPIYLRSALAEPASGGLPTGLSGDVRVMVSPASLPELAPDSEPASWRHDARALGDGRLESRPFAADGARMHDALELLRRAAENAVAYGVPVGDVASFRLALRDAFVSLPPTTLAAGRYAPGERSTDAATADGLVAAVLESGRLVPDR